MNTLLYPQVPSEAQRGRPDRVGVRRLTCAAALVVLVGCGGGGTAENMAKIQQQIDVGKFAEAVVGLKSVLQQSPNMAEGNRIEPQDLGLASAQGHIDDDGDGKRILDLRAVREAAERGAIIAALARTSGNVARSAELLGVSRPTLYDLMNRLAIKQNVDA